MSGARRLLAWLPPFVLGATGALAAELAAGLLLYSSDGLVRALSVVLATEAGAFGLGLWISRSRRDLEAVRRRWLLSLVAFTGAAGFSVLWGATGGFSAASLSQGLGLGLLGGLPLYGVGAVLGSLDVSGTAEAEGPGAPPGAAAALGAAVGLLAGGLYLIPRFHPTSLFLFGVVLLSGAAVVHGWLLDGRIMIRLLAEAPTAIGPVRIEERTRGAPAASGRVLLVGGRPGSARRREDGRPLLPWARAFASLVEERWPEGARVVVVGRGLGELLSLGGLDEGERGTVAVEPRAEIARTVAAASIDVTKVDAATDLRDGPPEEVLEESGPPFDASMVSLPLVTGLATVEGIPRDLLRFLLARTAPGGVVAVGGVAPGSPDPGGELETLAGALGPGGPALALYRPRNDRCPLLLPDEATGGGMLLAGVDPIDPWPPRAEGLVPVSAREGERRSSGDAAAAGGRRP